MLGDYYPLTPYSLANDAWIGWQFDRPETGDGMIQVFRRADSVYWPGRPQAAPPRGEQGVCRHDVDTKAVTRKKGRELMEQGLTVEIAKKPGAALLAYRLLTQR